MTTQIANVSEGVKASKTEVFDKHATTLVYRRSEELFQQMQEKIDRQPSNGKWSISLENSSSVESPFMRDSLERRAAERAAIKFDDMPEYIAYVEDIHGTIDTFLTVSRAEKLEG